MKTPEEKTNALPCCQVDEIACRQCAYFGKPFCSSVALKDALEKIRQLNETIILMKAQLHGDCGVCKHRHEQADTFRKGAMHGEFVITERCAQCIKKETRPNWEYENTSGV